MSNKVIRQLLEDRLEAVAPNFPTAYENINFNPPAGPYQMAYVMFAEPEDTGYKDSPVTQRGIFQINLMFPTNQGAGPAETKAELVRRSFDRGTSFPNAAGIQLFIERTPEIPAGTIEESRYVVRVKCRFYAHVPRNSL